MLIFYFRFRFRPFHRHRHVTMHRPTKFHPSRTTYSRFWPHVDFSRRRPQRRKSTSGFGFVDVSLWRMSKSIRKPTNIGKMSQYMTEMLLLPFSVCASAYQVSFESVNGRRRHDIIAIFKITAVSHVGFGLGNGPRSIIGAFWSVLIFRPDRIYNFRHKAYMYWDF